MDELLCGVGMDAPLLTPRQLECLAWVTAGKSSTDIGCILGISARTVDEHVAMACNRLRVKTRLQAVVAAVRLGLLQPAPSAASRDPERAPPPTPSDRPTAV